MNSVISKEVEVLKLGEIKFKDAWERQEEKFNSIIDTKIYNRKSKSQKKTKNYIGASSGSVLGVVIAVIANNILGS